MILSVIGSCRFMVKLVSRYICEVFGIMIAIIYIYEAFKLFGKEIDRYGWNEQSLLFLILFLFSTYTMIQFANARSWIIGRNWIRRFISDYAVALSVIIFSFVPVMLSQISCSKISISSQWNVYFVDFWNVSVQEWFLSILAAFILTVLVFFDHKVSSLLAQVPEMNLKKELMSWISLS
jgi:hypothetical protein